MFLTVDNIDFASYADDTTPYVCKQNYKQSINELENCPAELVPTTLINERSKTFINRDKCFLEGEGNLLKFINECYR